MKTKSAYLLGRCDEYARGNLALLRVFRLKSTACICEANCSDCSELHMKEVGQYFSTLLVSSLEQVLVTWSIKVYLTKVSVIPGYDFQTSQLIFFPLPQNDETVSHPVNAYQKRNPRHTFSPSFVA